MIRQGMRDIARLTGVSISTVDRTLNGRGSVKFATREHVLRVARELGYLTTPTMDTAQPQHQFHILVPSNTNAFLDHLSTAIGQAADKFEHVHLELLGIESFDTAAVCNQLDAIYKSDGVAVVAFDHPQVRESIRALISRNIPVVTLVTDIANCNRLAYVGIDNRAAGRLAGHLMCRFSQNLQGQVALFRGSPSYRGHEERENGFRAKLAESAPGLEIILAPETRDQIENSRLTTCDLIHRYPDLRGIYNAAGGNRGIAAGLSETGRADDVVFVAHELTQYSRDALANGVIDALIDQNYALEADLVLELLVDSARGHQPSHVASIPVQIYFPENLP